MPFVVSFSEKTWKVRFGVFKPLASVFDRTLCLAGEMPGPTDLLKWPSFYTGLKGIELCWEIS